MAKNEVNSIFKLGTQDVVERHKEEQKLVSKSFYITTDTHNLYFCDLDSKLHLLSQSVEIVNTKEELETIVANKGNIKFCLADKTLYVYNGTAWEPTNGDTWGKILGNIEDQADLMAALNKRVEKEIEGPNGKARIFNESDGGGAKFEKNDGSKSYVGVHNEDNGIGVQLYDVDKSNSGVIVDITKNGAYYNKGDFKSASERDVEDNELVVKKELNKKADLPLELPPELKVPGVDYPWFMIKLDPKEVDADGNFKFEHSGYNINTKQYYTWKDQSIPMAASETKGGFMTAADKVKLNNAVTKAVSDLINYYTKTETYTKDEVNELISKIEKLRIVVEDKLPDEGEENVLYLIRKETPEHKKYCDEYLWIKEDHRFEQIGNTTIDLSEYRKSADQDVIDANKLDLLGVAPGTTDEPYRLPFFFRSEVKDNKIIITAETISLDNKKTRKDYTMEILPASETTAGLMSAADKVSLKGKQNKLIAGENITIDEATNTISATGGSGEPEQYLKNASVVDEKLTINRKTGEDVVLDVSTKATKEEVAKKVDRELTSEAGKALIFNERDGGGAKFEFKDGTEAYVGVNGNTSDDMVVQIYADKPKEGGGWSGSRINVFNKGIYYQSKADTDAGIAKDSSLLEIATKRDVQDVSSLKTKVEQLETKVTTLTNQLEAVIERLQKVEESVELKDVA